MLFYRSVFLMLCVAAFGFQVACSESTTKNECETCNCNEETDSTEDISTEGDTETMTDSASEDTDSDTVDEPSANNRFAGPGCGEAPPAAGEATLEFGNLSTSYYVSVPDDYDFDMPIPVVYAFHGYGRTHNQMRQGDAGTLDATLKTWALVVYPKSVAGEGWDSSAERKANLEMFDALHRQILSDYCVDPDRVFATGLSSGGYFTNELACKRGNILRGVAPVSGAAEDLQNCIGQVAAVVINGMRDSVVPTAYGWEARDYYVYTNGCSTETEPGSEEECVLYDGCDADYLVQWCTHDEPTYSDTNHGWPSFATAAIDTFFQSLTSPLPEVSDENLIKDPFNLTNWSTYVDGATGEESMIGDHICLTLTEPGVNDWDAQIISPLFAITDETPYRVDFRAWSDVPTKIRARVGMSESPYMEYWVGRFSLDAHPQRFVRTFTMSETDDPTAGLNFQIAGAQIGELPVTVCVYDVVFSEISAE